MLYLKVYTINSSKEKTQVAQNYYTKLNVCSRDRDKGLTQISNDLRCVSVFCLNMAGTAVYINFYAYLKYILWNDLTSTKGKPKTFILETE